MQQFMPPGPTVLTLLGAFWPGNDASGPNQSYKAMATALGAEFDFRLVARNRPFGAAPSRTPGVPATNWRDLGFCRAIYLEPGKLSPTGLQHVLNSTPHDLLWLNGFFDREFTIPALVMRKARLIPRRPVILSPRGEFAAGALGLKSQQKRAYLALCRHTPLLEEVTLHATSADEASLITSVLPGIGRIEIAPNVRLLIDPQQRREPHRGGTVRLVFIGRIARVKNLDFALGVLSEVRVPVRFDIYGPVMEADHWAECQALIAKLQPNITVRHRGEIANDQIPAALAEADMLFLPTRGENFGHAIFEALSCGRPVLISDKTPWRNLEARAAGWDLPLAEPSAFARAIETFAALDPAAHARLEAGARAAAEHWTRDSGAIAATRAILLHAANTTHTPAQAAP